MVSAYYFLLAYCVIETHIVNIIWHMTLHLVAILFLLRLFLDLWQPFWNSTHDAIWHKSLVIPLKFNSQLFIINPMSVYTLFYSTYTNSGHFDDILAAILDLKITGRAKVTYMSLPSSNICFLSFTSMFYTTGLFIITFILCYWARYLAE